MRYCSYQSCCMIRGKKLEDLSPPVLLQGGTRRSRRTLQNMYNGDIKTNSRSAVMLGRTGCFSVGVGKTDTLIGKRIANRNVITLLRKLEKRFDTTLPGKMKLFGTDKTKRPLVANTNTNRTRSLLVSTQKQPSLKTPLQDRSIAIGSSL